MTILLTGATGTVGRAVLRQLLDAGAPVRALTRDPARAATLLPDGVDVVGGDLGDPDSLPAALDGVERVFLLSAGPQMAEHDANLAQAAAKAGVRRLVALSSLAAEEDPDGALGRWHADGERAVREAGPAWTIVRPGGFMSNALDWAPAVRAGVVRAPFRDLRAAIVDPRDIAAVVVAAMSGGHDGAVLPLSGPAAISPAEQVAVLADVLDRPVRFEELGVPEARAAMARRLPQEVVDAVLSARAAAGPFRARVLPTVLEVTGREPRSFRQWVEDHVDTFR
ncbi:NAD(P)H-binding protein [Dactylosporangium sp. NPDC049525]|uniref:NAD(P)H-binding protein n=1 Tax=Dactylosporangium sp. NPDC049525 TaxID=3154730 RepID=UPI0034372641